MKFKMNQKKEFQKIWDSCNDPEKSFMVKPFPKNQGYYFGVSIPLPKQIISNIDFLIKKLKRKFPNNEFIFKERYHITVSGLEITNKNYNKIIQKKYEGG